MRFSAGYLVTALIAMWLFQEFILTPLAIQATEVPYSEFKQKLASGQIVEVLIGETDIMGTMKDAKQGDKGGATVPFDTVYVPSSDPKLVEDLEKAGVPYRFRRPPAPSAHSCFPGFCRWP